MRSLRVRAMLVIGGIELVTMTILILSGIIYLHQAGLTRIHQHAEDAMLLIRTSVAESLFVSNRYSAAEIIDSALYEIPSISYLQLIGEDGEIVAEKRRGSDLTGGYLSLSSSIELGGVEFGKIHMHFSTAELKNSVQSQPLLLGGIALLGLAFSAGVSWFALGRLTALLETLASGLSEIGTGAPEPQEVPPGQELGKLVEAYNDLIDRVHPPTRN